MSEPSVSVPGLHLRSHSGLSVELNANGSLRHFECNGISVALFVGNEVEGGPTNVYLRRRGERIEWTPLLGPSSPTRFRATAARGALLGSGSWLGIEYSIALLLAQNAPAWFWHVVLRNGGDAPQDVDLTYTQDLALAPYGAVRLNEFYVSQYLDHTPLTHSTHGVTIASRQNQPADGRHPWCLIGSLRHAESFATDALDFHGLSRRANGAPAGIDALPSLRRQHEHSMVVLREPPLRLEPHGQAASGFFGWFCADHPEATGESDLVLVDKVLAQPEAKAAATENPAESRAHRRRHNSERTRVEGPATATLFSSAPVLDALDLDRDTLQSMFSGPWRHEEQDEHGALLSFFHGPDRHVVLRAKERRVQRPHGHILRTGRHLTPDETALTSTAWMGGVFNSMLTQGHVSINRFLSTVHSYLGLFRSHGQRVFVQLGESWHLLDTPSAFEMAPESCTWFYRHRDGEIRVRVEAHHEPQALTLVIEFRGGEPLRCLISHHIALNGDDGSARGPARWQRDGDNINVAPAPDTDLGRRFPNGYFSIEPLTGARIERVGGDELLFLDARSREEPYLCLVMAPARVTGLRIGGHLVEESLPKPLYVAGGEDLIPRLSMSAPPASSLREPLSRLAEIVPWYAHNALVHYLSPRGLEQYSGGGWGTRDVCQGPVEMLLALGRLQPIRDLLLRVMRTQNPDGDWPQWFMFFERERNIRPGDSHGDIVFWPVLVLAQYLLATGDASLLDELVPFFDPRGPEAGGRATIWEHVQRALSVMQKRVIPGTSLTAYGHGDWNDSLQPADPVMRERMCSAWTVTLHAQTLKTLARALRALGRGRDASPLESWASAIGRDCQRLLIADGVLAGYALFEAEGRVRYLLHPRDTTTGLRYSALAMIHAILEDMLTPAQTQEHLRLLASELSGPDGVRLFDRPMPYRGGLQRWFQRAETATFFGREIGLMYMHAHLRYAQALAHVGAAEQFFHALCQANPIGIRSIVPSATLRQANCYYSSSDAAFRDRYEASERYDRVARGQVPLDGGWRVYSSGAGIALGLVVRCLLGFTYESDVLSFDPVMPAALDGTRAAMSLFGRPVEVHYHIRSSDCGVNEITLNGTIIPFTRAANPHRRGAAVVPKAALLDRLTTSQNVLTLDVG